MKTQLLANKKSKTTVCNPTFFLVPDRACYPSVMTHLMVSIVTQAHVFSRHFLIVADGVDHCGVPRRPYIDGLPLWDLQLNVASRALVWRHVAAARVRSNSGAILHLVFTSTSEPNRLPLYPLYTRLPEFAKCNVCRCNQVSANLTVLIRSFQTLGLRRYTDRSMGENVIGARKILRHFE
jgi:hypothetical protein